MMKLNKVLLVDDSQPSNFLSKLTLQKHGINCSIDECLNGKKAVEYLRKSEECPGVILLDINMPVMDGFEFLENYKNEAKCFDKSKVFMLTSSARDEDKNKSMKHDFVKGYFAKPLTEEHVEEILASLQ